MLFRSLTVILVLFSAMFSAVPVHAASAMEGPNKVGNFGPTGLTVVIEVDRTLRVVDVQKGSPAEGKFQKDDLIVAINGKTPVRPGGEDPDQLFGDLKLLASFITRAEATDGALKFSIQRKGQSAVPEVALAIPVLGAYSKTWPDNCAKTTRILRAHADYLASVAGENGEKLIEHNISNGFAILALLSTGEEKDLDLVRKVYRTRMASFKGPDTGYHTWNNGVQGIAVCEYYLRSGDEAVIPLINAICQSASRGQVQGSWNHWSPDATPWYGVMNAAGTQLFTTMLMAKQCGAQVNEATLHNALTFFYRMAGHGNNPYGDHRPEGGISSNGKTGMLALAFGQAARAENASEVYALARDVSGLSTLYDYPGILNGHGGPYGALWCGTAAALMRDKMPELHANRLEHLQWFYELSRRHNGALGVSGAGGFDTETYGSAVAVSLAAPLKRLQITGAPKSPYAKTFTLPERPWGRSSDVEFLKLDPAMSYRVLDVPPHVESQRLATADEEQLRRFARHPLIGYREKAAKVIRDRNLLALCEELLYSDDVRARQTACMVINGFEPFGLRFSIGTRARYSLTPEQVTPRIFEGVMRIITDEAQPLWNVDQALLALAAVPPDMVKTRIDDITPWLRHEEWWLNESACVALTPVMRDEESLKKILPRLIEASAGTVHARARATMHWMIDRAMRDGPDSVKTLLADALVEVFAQTPKAPDPGTGSDWGGITSYGLKTTFNSMMSARQEVILAGARLSAQRINELQPRERDEMIDLMINAAPQLDDAGRKELGTILLTSYRRAVIGDDPAKLKQDMKGGTRDALARMEKLLAINDMAGLPGGWKLLGGKESGAQEWWHTSFEPANKPHTSQLNRYRAVELPESLANWRQPDYDPAKHDWFRDDDKSVEGITPQWYVRPKIWLERYLPQSGEVIFVRKTFELQDPEQAAIRLTVYSLQGYDVYLNGQLIASEKQNSRNWGARRKYFNDAMRKHLKPGTNVIAASSFIQYDGGGAEPKKNGGLMVYVEAIKEFPSVD